MLPEWFNDYLKECEEIQSNEICPRCGKKALVHVAEYDYLFACASCEQGLNLTVVMPMN